MSDDAPTIKSQDATVTLADGSVLEVTIRNPDMARWDMAAHQHKWPSMEDAPILWTTFVTWHAAKRTGLTDVKFETWRDEVCMDVRMHTDNGAEGGEEVGPTR